MKVLAFDEAEIEQCPDNQIDKTEEDQGYCQAWLLDHHCPFRNEEGESPLDLKKCRQEQDQEHTYTGDLSKADLPALWIGFLAACIAEADKAEADSGEDAAEIWCIEEWDQFGCI